MNIKDFFNLETVGWFLVALGWISQTYIAYGKRSTRTGKTSLMLMLLGFVVLAIAAYVAVRAFSPAVILHILIVLLVWMVYVRRR